MKEIVQDQLIYDSLIDLCQFFRNASEHYITLCLPIKVKTVAIFSMSTN